MAKSKRYYVIWRIDKSVEWTCSTAKCARKYAADRNLEVRTFGPKNVRFIVERGK